MRILHWCDCYPPLRGGTETVVQRLATAMAARGHQVAVATDVTEAGLGDEVDGGVGVYRFNFRRPLLMQDPAAVLRTLKAVSGLKQAFRPDVIHLHFLGASGFFHLRTSTASVAPLVVTIHGGLGGCGEGERSVLSALLNGADWVTGVSQAMVDEARRAAPGIGSRSSVIYNGDDHPPMVTMPDRPPFILCFGRHVRDKGFDLAISAMPAILARHPDVRLVIASDGPERSALEAQTRELGLANRVEFVGWLGDAELRDTVARATMAIVPSRWGEGFGLVALEAALAGRPVIATDFGGLPEVVIDGEVGLIVKTEDPSAISAAAVRLLDDPALAMRLGRAAAVRARAEFSLSAQLDNFTTLYEKLGAGRLTGQTHERP